MINPNTATLIGKTLIGLGAGTLTLVMLPKLKNMVTKKVTSIKQGVDLREYNPSDSVFNRSMPYKMTTIENLNTSAEALNLEHAFARQKVDQIKRDLIKDCERHLQNLIPASHYKFSSTELIGRPVYFINGVSCIDVGQEIKRIADEYPIPLPEEIKYRLIRYYVFGGGDTLYWWGVKLLRSGRWAPIVISKQPNLSNGLYTMKPGTRAYVLYPQSHEILKDLITNLEEVITVDASIQLSSTMGGPFPISLMKNMEDVEPTLELAVQNLHQLNDKIEVN